MNSIVNKSYGSMGLYRDPLHEFRPPDISEASYAMKDNRGIMNIDPYTYRLLTGRAMDGRLVDVPVDLPRFFMTVQDRNVIARLCTPVFSVVSARMNKISSLEWRVVPKRKREDRIAEELKSYKSYYDELKNSDDLEHLLIKSKIVAAIKRQLPDVLPDLSNFNGALYRWRKKIIWHRMDQVDEIMDWLQHPAPEETFQEVIKKIVYDMMIHSGATLYKKTENNKPTGRLSNFFTLPGGSIAKIRTQYASTFTGYVQVVSMHEPQVMFGNEISYLEYLPISNSGFPLIPLEALIHKTIEYMDMDSKMRNEADGTKPPSKMVIIYQADPGIGDFDSSKTSEEFTSNEQKRLEEKLKKPVKNRVVTFKGNGVEIVDLGNNDNLPEQLARQKDITEDVGRVFNATAMELNFTGSGDTSGRNTSEAQGDIFHGRGVAPFVTAIENYISYDIIRMRYNEAYLLEADKGEDEERKMRIDLLDLQRGGIVKNEIRERENKSTFPDPRYDLPDNANMDRGEELNPVFTKNVD
jgi:hypothetical protein